jgi:hypothetical protein
MLRTLIVIPGKRSSRSEGSGRAARIHGTCPERAQATEGRVWFASLIETDYYSSALAKQINQIFTVSPSFCNIAEVTSGHQVTLLTGRVSKDSFGGSGLSLFIFASRPESHFKYDRTISISSSAAIACSEVVLRDGSST